MQGMVVPKDSFPLRRKAACCGKECKVGESVVVVQWKQEGLERQVILHRRCLVAIIDDLPLDAADYQSLFASIKDAVIETGNPFPDKRLVRNRKDSGQ